MHAIQLGWQVHTGTSPPLSDLTGSIARKTGPTPAPTQSGISAVERAFVDAMGDEGVLTAKSARAAFTSTMAQMQRHLTEQLGHPSPSFEAASRMAEHLYCSGRCGNLLSSDEEATYLAGAILAATAQMEAGPTDSARLHFHLLSEMMGCELHQLCHAAQGLIQQAFLGPPPSSFADDQ